MSKLTQQLCILAMFFAYLFVLPLTAHAKSEDKPLRIIALAPHIVEMLFDIGAGEQIVGTTEHSDFPEAAKSIPRIGNYARLKIEHIIALQPDLILAWRTGNPSDDLERLAKLGFTIVYSDPKKLTDVSKELRHFGQLTHHAELAELKAQAFIDKLRLIEKSYINKQPVSLFYELWSRPLTTVAKNAWPQQAIALCGAKNPFINSATDYPQISVEQVVAYKPQIIIQPMSAGEPNPDAINWQQWPEIPAAKHQQVISPNSDMLHRMTPRFLDELSTLCQSIDQARTFYLNQ